MTHEQKLLIQGHAYSCADEALQEALARVYGRPERPRCLCVPGGLEMYIARLGRYVVKRMPETGHQHHPDCPSYEPEPGQSGLNELLGEAIVESSPDHVDLYLDFPLVRLPVRRMTQRVQGDVPADVEVPRRRLSLHALLHLLWERAGFNRWVPAMEGKRNWGVLRQHLLEAAQQFQTKGAPLIDFLHIPEGFRMEQAAAISQRRRDDLARLHSVSEPGAFPMMVMIGEFKSVEPSTYGRRVWLKHLPDCPLFIDEKAWQRAERVFKDLIEAREASPQARLRLVLAALVSAKAAFTYRIETLTLMLTTAEWIPVDGLPEAQLVAALVGQARRFLKPLRYDARASVRYPSALLLDTVAAPTPLTVVSSVPVDPGHVASVDSAMGAASGAWAWRINEGMPSLPASRRSGIVS